MEILGITGIDGNGQRELADIMAGLQTIKSGKIEYHSANNKPIKVEV